MAPVGESRGPAMERVLGKIEGVGLFYQGGVFTDLDKKTYFRNKV